MAASKAVTAARAATVPDKTVPAYTVPTAPGLIETAPIAQGEHVALSPTHPLGTKEGVRPTVLTVGQRTTAGNDVFRIMPPDGGLSVVTIQGVTS